VPAHVSVNTSTDLVAERAEEDNVVRRSALEVIREVLPVRVWHHLPTYADKYYHIYIYIYIYIYMYICINIYIYINMMYTYIHIYIQVYNMAMCLCMFMYISYE